MRTIYIIQGNTGEYSDRCDWLVKGYVNAIKAASVCDDLNKKLEKFGLRSSGKVTLTNEQRNKNIELMKAADDQFMCDYTGSYYCLLTVEVEG